MSRHRFWEEGDRRFPSRKQPAPEHGIKLDKADTSWWGQRWLDALQAALGADAGRLSRGKTYARAGRTHDLEVSEGQVHAQVTGSRPAPYEVTIQLQALPDDVWRRIVTGMAAKAQFSAELLSGQMPRDLEDVFVAAGSSLFPRERADLVTSCSCPDWGDPCKHVAATHYVLGQALDRDPFLLFELRGRSKEQVLEALRSARATPPEPALAHRATKQKGNERSKVTGRSRHLPAVVSEPAPKKRSKTAPRASKTAPTSAADYDEPRAPLPTLRFSFEPPASPGTLLRQLGAPHTWKNATSPADALAPLVHAAAERARSIALAIDEVDVVPEDEAGDPDR